jgi:hypothetical protein
MSAEPQIQPEVDPLTSEKLEKTNNQDEMIPYAKYRELLDEKKKVQAEKMELQTNWDKILSERENAEKTRLENEKQFKTLYENEKKRAEKALSLLEAKEMQSMNDKKLNAFQSKVGKLKNQSYSSFVDLDKIVVDNGNIDENSLDAYALEFKKTFPELIGEPARNHPPATAPKSDAVITTKMLKPDEILKQFSAQLRGQG